jgi:hypothetical protein
MKNSILYIWLCMAILLAVPRVGYSQCTDSSTVAASNLYLIKGAEARENLALCREFRKVDSAVIAQQGKIEAKLLDRIQATDKAVSKWKRLTFGISLLTLIFAIL